MSAFEKSPYAAEIRRLMETGFIDGVVHKLTSRYPHMASEIEDAVANAVLKLVTRKKDTPIKDVAGYVYGAARNGVMDAYHRASRYDALDVEVDERAHGAFEDELIDLEVLRSLRRLVGLWPNRNLQAYALLYLDAIRYDEPLSEEEAAERLAEMLEEPVNVKSISQWKSRSIKKLVQDYIDHRLGPVPAGHERTDR